MRSRGLPSAEGVAPAGRSAWARRVIVGGLGTAGATVALAAFAASAFANAANPLPDSHGTISPAGGTAVRVDVSGTWNWGELSGSSTQSDCTKRYGVGYAVDWWGFGTGGATIQGLRGQVAVTTGGTPTLTEQALAPTAAITSKKGGGTFHASTLLNGFDNQLCKSKDSQGFPQGPWSSYAIYPNEQSVPNLICVNMYDLHGSPGNPNLGDFTSSNGDNSIKTNDFNPTVNAGYCFHPTFQHPLSINVVKTNDADQNGQFTKSEKANSANQAVTFKVEIQNTSATAVAVIDGPIGDAYTGGPTNVCDGVNGNNVIGSVLQPNEKVTCTFTLNNYAPALNGVDKVNTVTVNAHEQGLLNNKTSGQSSSTVQAATGTSDIGYQKTGPANGLAGGTGDYQITLTNNGTATAQSPITFVDVLPVGETFNRVLATSDDGMSCSAGAVTANGQVVTCTYSKDLAAKAKAVVNIRANFAPGTEGKTLRDCVGTTTSSANVCWDTKIKEPKFQITKTGPDTGIPGGNGTYTITVKNIGDGPATAVSFVDNLPAEETFISASGDFNCTETSATKISCTAKSGLLPLDPNDSFSVQVLVKYALTTRDGDRLTDCAILPNLDQACKTTVIHTPDVVIGKTGPATGVAGDKGTYTISVKNNGQAPANTVTFTDQLPVGESYVSFSSTQVSCSLTGNPQIVSCTVNAPLAVGATATVDVTVAYSLDSAGKTLTDCAVLAPGNQSCVPTKIPGKPSLTVVKTNDANGDGVFHDTETANAKGDPVTFKVVITNNSAEPIALDQISDHYDVGVIGGLCPNLIGTVLNNGDSVTCTFTLDNYAPAAGSPRTNTIIVDGHQVPGGTPVSASDTSTVNTKQPPSPGEPDLAIVKNADQDRVSSGDTLTYTLAVSNVGDGSTTGTVTVTDSVPTGLDLVSVDGGTAWDCSAPNGVDITCTYLGGDLAPGDIAPVITITTTVTDAAVGTLVNTGIVDTPGDTNPTNDRSTVKTPVTNVLPEKVVKPQPTEVLPFTGDKTGQLLPIGLLTVLFGLALTVTGRRRRRTN